MIEDKEIDKLLNGMKHYTTSQIFRIEFIEDPYADKQEALDDWGHKIKWYDETEVKIMLKDPRLAFQLPTNS